MGLSGGLDVACWDIIGKAKGLPVYKLLAVDDEPTITRLVEARDRRRPA